MKKLIKSVSVCSLFVSLFMLTACVHQDANNTHQNTYQKEPSYLDARAGSVSGAYLAGRFAQHNSDWKAASRFMHRVLQQDDQNNKLMLRTFLLSLGDGDTKNAISLAEQLVEEGKNTELATILLILDAIAKDNPQKAWNMTEEIKEGGFNDYTKPLLQSWLLIMMGSDDIALANIKKHIDVFEQDPIYILHTAMMSEYTGDIAQAEEYYQKVIAGGDFTVHAVLAIANFYERHGQKEKAEKLYNRMTSQSNPYQVLSLTQMAEMVGKATQDPKEAVSLMLFELATLLYEKKAYDSALIYARLAQVMTPKSPFVSVMLGDISSVQGNYSEAVDRYNSVEEQSGMGRFARLKAAETLEASGRKDEAVAILAKAAEADKEYADTLIYLGDIYRRHEQYAEAVHAYDDALKRIGDVKAEHWFIVYARGMSLERLENWERAEQDLLKALELNPENPMVLNYLGYSWIDKGVHMDRAMEMIKKAVVLRPDDGYITDSYGWALFRQGNYAEAVRWLEYSVEHVPYDVTINDHLGDAYWRVGRRTEARFQWKRALNQAQDEADRKVLRHKIQFGLPDLDKKKPLSVEREAMLREF